MLSLAEKRAWTPPILECVATEGKGIEALAEAIADHGAFLADGNRLSERRRAGLRARFLEILRDRLLSRLMQGDVGEAELERCETDLLARRIDPYTAAREVLGRLGPEDGSDDRGAVHLDHIGVAVRRVEERLPLYRDVLGLPLRGIEQVEGEGVRVALLPAGRARVELVEPLSKDSPVGRFIEARGEGIHHLCFEVEDLGAALERVGRAGLEVAGPADRPGAEGTRIAFLHPRATGGVLIELREAGGGPARAAATRKGGR
jgi:methylmalonyl-CoA/ethylmalonyl-CoA epimerase